MTRLTDGVPCQSGCGAKNLEGSQRTLILAWKSGETGSAVSGPAGTGGSNQPCSRRKGQVTKGNGFPLPHPFLSELLLEGSAGTLGGSPISVKAGQFFS